jgi:ribonuclease M5
MRPAIREAIVVEGKDDVAAVKRACQAQTIITNGLGISREMIEQIRIAIRHCGAIVLTDPDAPGEKIRRIVNREAPGCKNAYLYRDRKDQHSPVGVEYAEPSEILAALYAAKATLRVGQAPVFSVADMVGLGLTGGDGARVKRDWLARRLGLGQSNGKQFLRRLNDYGISRQDFLAAYQEMIKSGE